MPPGARARTLTTALVEEAVLLNASGAPARAEALLRRAARMLEREEPSGELDVLRARVLVTRARSRVLRGDRAGAFAALDDADRLLDGAPPNPVESLAVVQRAGLHGQVGEWVEAAALLEGLPVTRDVAPRTRCLLRLNLGLSYQFLGRYPQSEAHLRRAHQDAVALAQHDLAQAAVHNLGRLRMLLGDLPAAMRSMEQANRMDGGALPPTADLDRARVLAEAGLVDRALSSLDEAEAGARAGGLAHDLAEIDLERARLALLRHELPEARRRAARAERGFTRRVEPAWAVRASLLSLHCRLVAGRRLPEVAEGLTRLADGPATASAVGAEAAVLAAEANARTGRLDEATRQLGRPEVRRSAAFPVRLQRHLATAELRRAEGRTAVASRELYRSAEQLVREQARHSTLDSRTAVALHTGRLRDAHVALALSGGSAGEVFAVTELWRAVSHRLPPVTGSPDPEVARLTADARRLHAEARESEDPAHRAELLRAARRAQVAAEREQAASAADVDTTSSRPVRPVTVGALRPHLRDSDTGVLGLFHHRGEMYAVTVTHRGAQLTQVRDRTRLVAASQRLRVDLATRRHAAGTPFAAAVDRSLRRAAAQVGDALADVIPSTDRIVVLPSQVTSSMPWRLVPGMAGRPLVVAPSATFWTRRREQSARVAASSPRVTALAGPDLPQAGQEVLDVAEAWGAGARHLAPGEATGAALAVAVRDSDVVHVAAHGVHEDENPLFSSVLMADGPAWVHDLQRAGVGARHVVLSSCEVGRTYLREGDEGLGLTAGLLSSGVHAVVGAVAPVGDVESHAVMTRYHRLLAAGIDAASALEAASADVPDGPLFAVYGSDLRVMPARNDLTSEVSPGRP